MSTTLKLKVKPRHEAPANRAPEVSRLTRGFALARQPLALPVLAVDRDGDPVTISLVSGPEGATFDPATATLHWTPTHEQLGRHTIRFTVSDGTKTRKHSVKLRVHENLLGW